MFTKITFIIVILKCSRVTIVKNCIHKLVFDMNEQFDRQMDTPAEGIDPLKEGVKVALVFFLTAMDQEEEVINNSFVKVININSKQIH